MTVCSSCGKENQALYKFCLGCGADLAQGTHAKAPAEGKRPTTAPPVFSGMGPADGGESASVNESTNVRWSAPPVPAMAASGVIDTSAPATERSCPACGHGVPPGFTFCANCGARVGDAKPAAPAAPAPASPRSDKAGGRLVLVRPDGTEGGSHPLAIGENLIGRGAGPLFEADGYLSPKHATLVLNAAGLVVRDTHSLNGVFLKLLGEEELDDNQVFRMGQELLRFEAIPPPEPLDDGTEVLGSPNPGFWGRLAVVVARDYDGSAYPLFGDAIILGREHGDVVFPEDGYVSGTHARISYREGRCYLADLNSSNGTFIRIQGERAVPSGSLLLMGQQLFRVSYP